MNIRMVFYLFISVGAAFTLHVAAQDTIKEAIMRGDMEGVQRFISADPTVVTLSLNPARQTALHVAALFGHNDIARLLLSQGAQINQPDVTGCAALHFAVAGYASRDCVIGLLRMLLEYGADVNQRSKGTTPLQLAEIPAKMLFGGRRNNAAVFLREWPRQQRMRKAQLAVMLALLPRIGAGSPLRALGKDNVEQIARRLRPEHF